MLPGPLGRLERHLLVNAPLLWRSRVLRFFIFSFLLANLLLFGLAHLYPVRVGRVPDIKEISNVMLLLYAVGMAALVYYFALVRRQLIPEQRASTYATLTLLHAACVFSVLLNPLAFVYPVVGRIANVFSDERFPQEYVFHEQFGFWYCDARATAPAVELNRQRILRALRDYGVAESFGWIRSSALARDPDCDIRNPSIISLPHREREFRLTNSYVGWINTLVYDDRPMVGLRDRMASVRAAKAFEAGQPNRYSAYADRVSTLAVTSLLLGLVLVAASYPPGAWRRRLYGSDHLLGSEFRLPVPGVLMRLDRSLLANHPVAWSTLLPSFEFQGVVYGGLALALVVVAGGGMERLLATVENVAGDTGLILFFIVAGIVLSLGWAKAQARIELRAARPPASRAALSLLLLGAAIAPLLVSAGMLLIEGPTYDWAFSALFVFAGWWLLSSWVYATKYVSNAMAAAGLLGTVLTLVLLEPIILDYTHEAFAGILVWAALAVFLTWHVGRRPAGWVEGVAAATQVMLVPLILLETFLMFRRHTHLPEGGLLIAFLTLSWPAYLLLTAPAIPALIRARYYPLER